MRVLITGGTGFIGQALIPALTANGHDITVLTRQSSPRGPAGVTFIQSLDEISTAVDAVINLAGASLADKRWSDAYKDEMVKSRVELTRRLGEFFAESPTPPGIWLNASAIGYYGPCGDKKLDESSPAGEGFAADLCRQWEAAAIAAAGNARLCIMRLGVVLDAGGGAYPQMAQPFKMGVANWIGDGHQWLSWVHRKDVVAAFSRALEDENLHGAINVTAPEPVTSREFCSAMRKVHRTFIALPMPGPVMRAMVGEMADELLLSGQRVSPEQLLAAKFPFKFATVDKALAAIETR